MNPIGSPALTGDASAVLVIDNAGHSTVVVACAFSDGWFVAGEVGRCSGTSCSSAKSSGSVTCTVAEAPDARSPKLQLSVLAD